MQWESYASLLEVRKSDIDGKGVFALAPLAARRKLGELAGELIKLSEARRRARESSRIAIVDISDDMAIDATRGGNLFRYVNHSCSPNTFIRICYGHVEFYSLREIRRGEELTCDYGLTYHEGTHPCQCGSANCRRYI